MWKGTRTEFRVVTRAHFDPFKCRGSLMTRRLACPGPIFIFERSKSLLHSRISHRPTYDFPLGPKSDLEGANCEAFRAKFAKTEHGDHFLNKMVFCAVQKWYKIYPAIILPSNYMQMRQIKNQLTKDVCRMNESSVSDLEENCLVYFLVRYIVTFPSRKQINSFPRLFFPLWEQKNISIYFAYHALMAETVNTFWLVYKVVYAPFLNNTENFPWTVWRPEMKTRPSLRTVQPSFR